MVVASIFISTVFCIAGLIETAIMHKRARVSAEANRQAIKERVMLAIRVNQPQAD